MERTDKALKPIRNIGNAEIYAGDNLYADIPHTLAGILEDGQILLLYDRGTKESADKTAAELKGYGYRVSEHDIAEHVVPEEYCRLVFGVGAGSVAEACAKAAAALDADCALYVTAPSCASLLAGGRVRHVYLDKSTLNSCPRECVAAGWGLVLSQAMDKFEDYFGEKVLAQGKCVETAVRELRPDADETALAVKLLEMSAEDNARGQRDKTASATAAELLACIARSRGKKQRLYGEYKFIAACALGVFYSSFLASPAIDTMPPADHDTALGELALLTGESREKLTQSIDFFDVNAYFRINYILSEYRVDLLEKLSGIDLRSCERRWRRLYDDAGYWLKGAVTARDVMRAMALAGETCGGLLHYAAATGFCERMLA